jgi:two-component system, LytTR family, response regulator
MKLNVAIIDDEMHAIETLTYDLRENHSTETHLLFSTTNPVEGIKKLRSEKPDLVFLDIDMPGLSGLELVELIDDLKIQVIFTTAHQEYAVQAVETIASGYLLKPVQPDDLQRIIEKAKSAVKPDVNKLPIKDKIPVPDNDGIELVLCEDIIYCKSDSNYCTLVLAGKRKITASKTLKHFEELLSNEQFIRVHKSYLVNRIHIKKYLKKDGGELVMSNNDVIPLSRNTREEIVKLIQSYL